MCGQYEAILADFGRVRECRRDAAEERHSKVDRVNGVSQQETRLRIESPARAARCARQVRGVEHGDTAKPFIAGKVASELPGIGMTQVVSGHRDRAPLIGDLCELAQRLDAGGRRFLEEHVQPVLEHHAAEVLMHLRWPGHDERLDSVVVKQRAGVDVDSGAGEVPRHSLGALRDEVADCDHLQRGDRTSGGPERVLHVVAAADERNADGR